MTPQPIPSTGPRPRTEAGRRLLAKVVRVEDDFGHEWDVTPSNAVRAIEAEARAAALAAVEEAVRGLPTWDKRTAPGGFYVKRGAVLAVLAKLQEDPADKEAETSHE